MPIVFVFCSTIPPGAPPSCVFDTAKKLSTYHDVVFITIPTRSVFNILLYIRFLINLIKILVRTEHSLISWQNFTFLPTYPYLLSRVQKFIMYIPLYLYLQFKKIKGEKIVLITMSSDEDDVYKFIPAYASVFDCLDVYYPEMFQVNNKQISRYDAVLAHTDILVNELTKINSQTYRFSPGHHDGIEIRTSLDKIPHSVVFAGGISKRISYMLLTQVIDMLPHIQFYFIGEQYLMKHYVDPAKDRRCLTLWVNLLKRKNVHYLGSLPLPVVNQLLPLFEVAIIPYLSQHQSHEYSNRETVPIKLLAYLANHLPVVTTRLPSIEELAHANKLKIYFADDPNTFTKHIQDALSRNNISLYNPTVIKKILASTSIDTKITQLNKLLAEIIRRNKAIL